MELVHSDVCGPMKVKSLGGASYYVTFINDATKKMWVYAIKYKDDVLGIFKYFYAKVERKSGKPLKCIRTDNGGEYIGEFQEYCKSHDIRHEQTESGTPQHNDVVERMNWTICDKIRCMLSLAKLPRFY